MRGYDCDVIVEGEPHLTFELKCRKPPNFKTIYDLYFANAKDGIYRFHCEGRAVAISIDVKQIISTTGAYTNAVSKTHSRVVKMSELLSGANYLVIKEDRRDFLFISYS
jgi:hypothetical protein